MYNMLIAELQDNLAAVLQQNLKFIINGKTIKEGKLLLYNIKDYYITFTLVTPKEVVKTYEIPIPFKIAIKDGDLIFNYAITTLSKKDPDKQILIRLLLQKIGKKSKFYDNALTITCR